MAATVNRQVLTAIVDESPLKSVIASDGKGNVSYTKDSAVITLTDQLVGVEKPVLKREAQFRREDEDEELKEAVKRGKITTFTRESQKRFMAGCSAWVLKSPRLVFVTLTQKAMLHGKKGKKAREQFLRKMRRKYPHVAGCWRLEYQLRLAAHYHLLCDGFGFDPATADAEIAEFDQWCRTTWADICNEPANRIRTEAVYAESEHGSKYYLTKELGKSVQSALSDDRMASIDHDGRFWGWFNKGMLLFRETILCVPKTIAYRIENEIQTRVLAKMIKDKKVIRRGDKFFWNNGKRDKECDPKKLQRWMIFPDRQAVWDKIWTKVWRWEDMALLGLPTHEVPDIELFLVIDP